MPVQMASTDSWRLVRAQKPSDCGPLAELLHTPAVYEVALCLGYAPTASVFAEMLKSGEIAIWQCQKPGSSEVMAWAIDVFRFDDHEMYVWCREGWNNTVVAEILPLMAQAIFTQDKSVLRIWMVLPLPLPKGSEEMLMGLGFDPWRDDMAKDVKKTFGMERTTWEVYTGQSG